MAATSWSGSSEWKKPLDRTMLVRSWEPCMVSSGILRELHCDAWCDVHDLRVEPGVRSDESFGDRHSVVVAELAHDAAGVVSAAWTMTRRMDFQPAASSARGSFLAGMGPWVMAAPGMV